MLFSIIIPVYNVEKYLPECLDSVLKQSFQDWEAICVDDESSDNSPTILKEYAAKDARIRVFRQDNAGTAAARNTGLKEAKGDYIFFLDSDDWIEVNALQTLADRVNGEDIICFSGKRYFESSHCFNRPDILQEKVYTNGMDYYNENALLARDFAFVCVVLRIYDRLFLLNYRLFFDEDVSFEDNLWVPITVYHAHSIIVIPDSLYIYRIREGSKMQEPSFNRKKDMLKVANRLAAFYIPQKGFDKTPVYRAITHHYQVVFNGVSKNDAKELSYMCDWGLYRTVSRTKPRHIINYFRNRLKVL